jgi:hypothetical protein
MAEEKENPKSLKERLVKVDSAMHRKMSVDLMVGRTAADIYKDKKKKQGSSEPYYDWSKNALPPKIHPTHQEMGSQISDGQPQEGAPKTPDKGQPVLDGKGPFYGQLPEQPRSSKQQSAESGQSEDEEQQEGAGDSGYEPASFFAPPSASEPQATDGWMDALSGSLKERMQKMGKEALEDPAIKRSLHSLGWDVFSTFITPAVIITFPAANYFAIAGRIWKKEDYTNPLYHMFSLSQFWLLIAIDLLLFIIVLGILALIVITYCLTLGILSSTCREFGILNLITTLFELF